MTRRRQPVDRALEEQARLVNEIGEGLRHARYATSQSQGSAASNAGMSQSQWARLEGGRLRDPTIGQVLRAHHAVGLTTSLVHDASGLEIRTTRSDKLITKLASMISPALEITRHEGLPDAGDQRGWDAMLGAGGGEERCILVDAEDYLTDVPDLHERLVRKLRDDGRSRVMLLVVRNHWRNRRALAMHHALLAVTFPMESKRALWLLKRGLLPPESGIVLLWNSPPAGNPGR